MACAFAIVRTLTRPSCNQGPTGGKLGTQFWQPLRKQTGAPCLSHLRQMKRTNNPFRPSNPLRFQHVLLSAPPDQGVFARDDIESVRSIFLHRLFLCKRLLHLCSCFGSWPISSGAAATASGSACVLTQEQSHLTSLILLRSPPNLARSWKLAGVLWRSRSVPVVRPRLRCSGC
jgi:hypothetical protein